MGFKVTGLDLQYAAQELLAGAAGSNSFINRKGEQASLPKYVQAKLEDHRARNPGTWVTVDTATFLSTDMPGAMPEWQRVMGTGRDGKYMSKAEIQDLQDDNLRDFTSLLYEIAAARKRADGFVPALGFDPVVTKLDPTIEACSMTFEDLDSADMPTRVQLYRTEAENLATLIDELTEADGPNDEALTSDHITAGVRGVEAVDAFAAAITGLTAYFDDDPSATAPLHQLSEAIVASFQPADAFENLVLLDGTSSSAYWNVDTTYLAARNKDGEWLVVALERAREN